MSPLNTVNTDSSTASQAKFGTFAGVFTPCVLTILGVIMFLRFGQVVGQAGVWYTLAIVAIAKAITGVTALSLSAIATNTRVKGGGAYFLISRSLGVEFGGAIGLVFFLAQAISVAMYVIGFAEAFTSSFSLSDAMSPLVASLTNAIVFACVMIGAGWTIRLQYFILAALGASIVSFVLGAWFHFDSALLASNAQAHFAPGENFFTMFALFFPAVTGIMAGANMSGDLKDPARAIPLGTISAIICTGLVYAGMAILLGGSSANEVLSNDTLVVSRLARWPQLITLGVFAATISSALGSMMGAPRILQAFARDNVFKSLQFFSGNSNSSEPRKAIVLTFVISQACILLADLNTIAPLITMFFMVTYGLLNLATFYEGITKNPSYRPRFRFSHWTVSLVGAIGCTLVMFLIDWRWAAISILSIAFLHRLISRKEVEAGWGDLQSGLLFERARKNLLRLEEESYHPKNWRPFIIAFSGIGWSRAPLAVYGHWLSSGHGILTLGQVIQGEVDDLLERRASQQRILQKFVQDQNIEAFTAVVVAPFVSEGIENLVQCHGLGALSPNSVMLGWPSDRERVEAFCSTLRTVVGLKRSVLALRLRDDQDEPPIAPQGSIDVWWRGHKNGELMLLLAYLLTKNPDWRDRKIRLCRVVDNETAKEEVAKHLDELAKQARIRATTVVVIADDARTAIANNSCDAAIVLMGFESPGNGDELEFHERTESWAGDLKRVLFVNSIGGMSLNC